MYVVRSLFSMRECIARNVCIGQYLNRASNPHARSDLMGSEMARTLKSVLRNFRSYIHLLPPPGIQYLFCLDVVIEGNPIACQFLDCQPHCVLSFSFSAGFGSDMTCHLPQPF